MKSGGKKRRKNDGKKQTDNKRQTRKRGERKDK
jgi:hypothetical protein